MKNNRNPWISSVLLAIAANASPLYAEEAPEAFTNLAQEIQTDPAKANEAQVLQLLEMARDQQRALQASVAVEAFLNINSQAALPVILASARNAVLAGDLRQASDRYSQYLYRATPDEESSEVAAEFLTLQVNYLSDENAAYSFLTRSELKFRQAPDARRFDTWYLSQALGRSDWQQFAQALATMVASTAGPAQNAQLAQVLPPSLRTPPRRSRKWQRLCGHRHYFARYVAKNEQEQGRPGTLGLLARRGHPASRRRQELEPGDHRSQALVTCQSDGGELAAVGNYFGRTSNGQFDKKIFSEQGNEKLTALVESYQGLSEEEQATLTTMTLARVEKTCLAHLVR